MSATGSFSNFDSIKLVSEHCYFYVVTESERYWLENVFISTAHAQNQGGG